MTPRPAPPLLPPWLGKHRRLLLLGLALAFLTLLFQLIFAAAQTALSAAEMARLHAAWLHTSGQRGGLDHFPAGRPLEIRALAILLGGLGADFQAVLQLRMLALTLFVMVLVYYGQIALRLFGSLAAALLAVGLVAITPSLASVAVRVGAHGLATLGFLLQVHALLTLCDDPDAPVFRRYTVGGVLVALLTPNAAQVLTTLLAMSLYTMRRMGRGRPRKTLAMLGALLIVIFGTSLLLPDEASARSSFAELARIPAALRLHGVIQWVGDLLYRNPLAFPLVLIGTALAAGAADPRRRLLALGASVGIAFDLLLQTTLLGVSVAYLLGGLAAAGGLVDLARVTSRFDASPRLPLTLLVTTILFGATLSRVFASLREEANFTQLDTLRAIDQLSPPGDPIFDGYASYLFRPHVYASWSISKEVRRSARKVDREETPEQALRRTRCKILLRDSAVRGLPRSVARFIDTHYLPWRDLIWVAGVRIAAVPGQETSIDLVADGEYGLLASSKHGRVRIDGVEHSIGSRVALAAGPHRVTLAGIDRAMLRLAERGR